MYRLIGMVIAVAVLSSGVMAQTQTPEQKGMDIAREADRRGEGFGDFEASMKMVLSSRRGDRSERELRVRTLEGKKGEGDKSLTIFDTPADVRGTALLSWSHADRDDDQWLYLPALKRVKTIASRSQSGAFMGSEFAFEDMRAQEVDKYTYKYLRDEPCGDLTCFVFERYPQDKYSGYTRQVVWMDQAEYRVHKIDYYDRKQSLLKTLSATDHQQYLERFWQPGRMEMVNHQTGKTTELLWSDYRFNTGLGESDFTQNSLMRAR
ncbi:outer membrane lipoprotein-sorting protein [Alcanivorax sp. 1008]|uniref:outer membrane lipoprotein-sorting protein n=1 Tax=Alcanivorax sp. 1008 TaxID=2816853 RepID=UPI001D7AD1A3|nr:outer membrane lipoprotein-sorting protein [Alcanivorax sp. 1008]MCC1498330.1 outer membrane lipoprotein-sorting protein [Alcanivorax sp. 1008]